jgi:hypothetical protein
MFWDPTTSCFLVSANFRLDPDHVLGDPFPGIQYNSRMSPSVISGDTAPRKPFPPGSPVFAVVDNDIYEGNVISVPTPQCPWYSVLPIGGSAEPLYAPACNLCLPDDPMLPLDQHLDQSSELPSLPPWLKQDSQMTLESDGASCWGYFSLSDQGTWEFVQQDGHGGLTYHIHIGDLPHTWRSQLLDGSLCLGWSADMQAYHVHAHGLRKGVPGLFASPCRKTTSTTTFGLIHILTWDKYKRKLSHVKVIPSMNIKTIKKPNLASWLWEITRTPYGSLEMSTPP